MLFVIVGAYEKVLKSGVTRPKQRPDQGSQHTAVQQPRQHTQANTQRAMSSDTTQALPSAD